METFETNVAKIQIGNSKQTNTYVTTLAERTVHDDCELFSIIALPVLNPAALDDCERIAAGILGALRRCYKRSSNENTFEVALGEINDEIGKLASLKQNNWTGKISGVVAVRHGSRFYAAATGKASTLLMRDGEFNEITESSQPKHPLKTFDTFSAGKIKVGDVIIITTAELFNHVSVDRIRNILGQNTLEIAAQEVVRIIEDTAGPEVAFGTLLLQETEPVLASDEGMQLTDFAGRSKNGSLLNGLTGKAKQVVNKETAQAVWHSLKSATKKRPNLDVRKLSGMALSKSTEGLSRIKAQAQNYKNIDFKSPYISFKGFSRSKQFFTISVIVLVVAVVVNLFIARGRKQETATNTAFEQTTTSIQKLLSDADSKLVFKDEAAAANLVAEAEKQAQNLTSETDSQKQTKEGLESQISELSNRINKTESPTVTSIATLSNAESLITLPNILATATGTVVVSYNTNTKTTEDGTIRTSSEIKESVYTTGSDAVIFDGQGLQVWNFSTGKNNTPFFLNVAKAANFVGLVRYATNGRIYSVDTNLGQVMNYTVTATTLSKPAVSVKENSLKEALDLAVDGSIYVLTHTGVNKYTAGKAVPFTFPALSEPFSGKGKIFTDTAAKQVYILDSNGRIIITDKTGKLVKVLAHKDLKDATDFTVDEANKIIYVLRTGSLLKVDFSL